jgi:leucyl aminopeptidase (aminopeptidase T)
MNETLSTEELTRLVKNVFGPRAEDRRMAILFDLPDGRLPDTPEWADRRALAADWWGKLSRAVESLGLDSVELIGYRNARSNNADLPGSAWRFDDDELPDDADRVDAPELAMEAVFDGYDILVALTELSATAPMKLAAPRFGFRAATMPGFTRPMIPALRLDWEEIHRRCVALEQRLDRADGAELRFRAEDRETELHLDLRHRRATASGGRVHEPGTAGNLPSGETYIVPYEGELEGDPSRSCGVLPVRLDGELLFYRIEGNRAVEVEGTGPVAKREARAIRDEPAYANLAELGLGLLGDYGIRPVGRILLDEKLAPHIAFGRSDHFGGQVGAAQFSSPEKVVHIDRVYLPEMQPGVRVVETDLLESGERRPLIRDGRYV